MVNAVVVFNDYRSIIHSLLSDIFIVVSLMLFLLKLQLRIHLCLILSFVMGFFFSSVLPSSEILFIVEGYAYFASVPSGVHFLY
jgi:hypothetical protein